MEKLGLAMAEVSHDGRDQVKLHYMGQVDMAARQLKEFFLEYDHMTRLISYDDVDM